MKHTYKTLLGKTENEVIEAQDVLVDSAIFAGLRMMYRTMREQKAPVEAQFGLDDGRVFALEFDLPEGGRRLVETPEEALKALQSFDGLEHHDPEIRVSAFNQLAITNGFDLALKTTGHKSVNSIVGKMGRRSLDIGSVKDIVRITAISSNDKMIKELGREFKHVVDEHAVRGGHALPEDELRPWHMTKTANFKSTFNTRINGIAAEMLCVPAEQANVAERITHTYYECVRRWRELCESEGTHKHKAAEKEAIVAEYNRIADVLNTIVSDRTLGREYLPTANMLFKNDDMSAMTYDAEGEGKRVFDLLRFGDAGPKRYSPIFKDFKDFRDYRNYLNLMKSQLKVVEDGEVKPLFPLPPLMQIDDDVVVDRAISRLNNCTQLTHACYMRFGEPAMRAEWVKQALVVNAKTALPQAPKNAAAGQEPQAVCEAVPAVLIDSVNRGKEGALALQPEEMARLKEHCHAR